jgi:hypothetical protein
MRVSLSDSALSKMRDHPEGLAAALVYCNALGLSFPAWVSNTLTSRQLLMIFSARRPRQNKVLRQMKVFSNHLLRYYCACHFAGPRSRDGNDKMERVFEQIDGLAFADGVRIAPKDSSGLKKSYYKFQRMFGSRMLSRYVADTVVAAWMSR